MKQRSKWITCLILGLMMILSVFGYGMLALAAEPAGHGKQADEPAASFDANGWFTQNAYNAMADKNDVLAGGAALIGQPGDGYLGYIAPEAAGGYTKMASFAQGKLLNNKVLPVSQAINFQIGIMPSAGGHAQRLVHFFDEEKVGTYIGVNEKNTPFAIMFSALADTVEIFVNGTKQTLANDAQVFPLDTSNTMVLTETYVMHYVSIVMGAESSQVYIDGEKVADLTDLKTTNYSSGNVQMVLDFWGGGGDPWVAFNALDPFVLVNASYKDKINVKTFEEDLSFTLSKAVAGISVVNAAAETVTLEKDKDYTVDGNTVTVANEFLTEKAEGYFDVDTVFTFTSAEEPARTATYGYEVLYYAPPVYEQAETTIVKTALTEDVTYAVAYENGKETYGMTVNGAALAAENYTATFENGKINVTLKKEYLNGLSHGVYTFTLSTLAGSVDHVVYRNEKDNEWIVKGNGTTGDESAEEVVKGENGSSTLNVGFLGNAYYSENIDVSKPVYLEMDFNTVLSDPNPHGWFAIGFTNDVTQVDKLNESNPSDRLTFLYVHAKGEFQCAGVLANALIKPEYINQNGPQLFEIRFAQADAEGKTVQGQETTLYFNGHKIFGTDTKNQATFEKGCFLGIFSALDVLNFTTRTDITSAAANTYGLEYTLGTDADISVPVYNTASVTAVKYAGEALASSDYTFADGILTLKGSYLKTIAYADTMTFTVTADNGVELTINVKAYCEADASKAVIAKVGAEGAVFEKGFAGKTVSAVIDTATSKELSSEDYKVAADGTLTVAKAYFTAEGTYSFAVVTDGGLYFAMAINRVYENNWANNLDVSNGTYAEETLTVKGESDYLYSELVDLTKDGGVAYTLTVQKLNGYFKNGQDGSTDAYVAIYFYDMFSGNTVTLAVYANDEESSSAQLAYVKLYIRDKDGKQVYVNNMPIADNPNFYDESVIGANVIRFSEDNGSLKVDFNDYSIYLDLGETDLSRLQMGVCSTADIEGVKNEYSFSFKVEEQTEDPGTDPGTDPDGDTDKDETGKGGCSGSAGRVAASAGAVLLGAAAFGLMRKRKGER